MLGISILCWILILMPKLQSVKHEYCGDLRENPEYYLFHLHHCCFKHQANCCLTTYEMYIFYCVC